MKADMKIVPCDLLVICPKSDEYDVVKSLKNMTTKMMSTWDYMDLFANKTIKSSLMQLLFFMFISGLYSEHPLLNLLAPKEGVYRPYMTYSQI